MSALAGAYPQKVGRQAKEKKPSEGRAMFFSGSVAVTFCCDVPNIDLLDANLAARKIGPHKGGSDRRERAFVGKRSDDGAAKIPPRFGWDDCREVHRDVARCEGFEPPWRCRLTVFKTAPL